MKEHMSTNFLSRIRDDKAVAALTAGLAVALAVALILLAALWHGASNRRTLDDAEADALDAAQGYATDVTTYDYRHLDKDFAWADDGATSSFAKQYREANKPLCGIIEKLKATAKGTVTEAAATADSDTEVQVLMFIDQRISDKTNKQTRSDKSRVVMSMVKQDGHWLVDDVQLR